MSNQTATPTPVPTPKPTPAATPTPAAAPKHLINNNDIFQSWVRWLFFAHANYNYERYQATGFAHAMAPIIEKLYKTKEDRRSALMRHLVFFNTEPDTGGGIHGMTIALEEQRAQGNTEIDDATINNIKYGLMGPFAGLGDTLKQGIWFPVWQSIGIGLAVAANGAASGILGPLIFLAATAVYTFVFGPWLYFQGYYQGQVLVARFLKSGLLDDIRTGAAVLGTAVLSALAAQFVTVATGLSFTVNTGTGTGAVKQTFNVQKQLFDALYPSLLPLITLLIVIWLFRRGVSAVTVILYMFGITLASALIESVSRYTISGGWVFGVFTQLDHSWPTLLGIVLLFVGAYYAGMRSKNTTGAVRFIIAFLVVTVVVAILSPFIGTPVQLLAHF